jgi:hypothetical protein
MSLYRMHLIAIHGWWRGIMLIVIGHVNQIVRPRLKLALRQRFLKARLMTKFLRQVVLRLRHNQ